MDLDDLGDPPLGDTLVVDEPPCPSCDGQADIAPEPFVYALGRIEARFPSLATEKELAQVLARADTAGMTDQQAFHAVLSARENRYLARQLCWVLSIQGLETYVLQPREPLDLDLMIESIRPVPDANDIDVVVGTRGPVAAPEVCNGLMLPVVSVDQVYSFERAALIDAIPRPEKISAAKFGPAAEELFDRIRLLTDNAGATDEHRASNYLAMRYPAIYAKAADQFASDAALTGVEVRASALSGARSIVDVVFTYTGRKTDVTEKWFVRVDVTEEFPFLVTRMAPYLDR